MMEPALAANRYRASMREATTHHRINAPVQAPIVRHPVAVSLAGRALTAPVVRSAVAGAWGLYWNDLVRGARPGRNRAIARATTRLVTASSQRSEVLASRRNRASRVADVTCLVGDTGPTEPRDRGLREVRHDRSGESPLRRPARR
jgi:hypothetical protein